MVFRAIIWLPVYLAVMFFAPGLSVLAPIFEAVRASGANDLMPHVIGYGIAIPIALAIAALCSRWEKHWRFGAIARVIQVTFIGVAAMGAYQLFLYFTS